MLRADLAEARYRWLEEAKPDPEEYERRTESDVLAVVNHEGERLDFHALRHTGGAWRALRGVQPKMIQTVMRHSSVELTMGPHGHLVPGQEADAVAGSRAFLAMPAIRAAPSGRARRQESAAPCVVAVRIAVALRLGARSVQAGATTTRTPIKRRRVGGH